MPGNEYYLTLSERSAGYEGPHAELVTRTPDFYLLLHRLLADRRLTGKYKAYLAQVLSFMTAPIDVLHDDFIGKATYMDDLCAAGAVLRVISRCQGPQLINEHWHKDYDLHQTVDQIVRDADLLIGQGRLRLILESVGLYFDAREKYSLDESEWS